MKTHFIVRGVVCEDEQFTLQEAIDEAQACASSASNTARWGIYKLVGHVELKTNPVVKYTKVS